jgi:hypothetical protein
MCAAVGLVFVEDQRMRRSTHPTEILLGFAAGLIVALVVQQPLVWFLHHFGLTAQHAFSTQATSPMSVQAVWSRMFWGGVFGVALAWFGTRYVLGSRWLVGTITFGVVFRTFIDWVVVPIFWWQAWPGYSLDTIVTPLILNIVWAIVTAGLLAVMSLAAGTWGSESVT